MYLQFLRNVPLKTMAQIKKGQTCLHNKVCTCPHNTSLRDLLDGKKSWAGKSMSDSGRVGKISVDIGRIKAQECWKLLNSIVNSRMAFLHSTSFYRDRICVSALLASVVPLLTLPPKLWVWEEDLMALLFLPLEDKLLLRQSSAHLFLARFHHWERCCPDLQSFAWAID